MKQPIALPVDIRLMHMTAAALLVVWLCLMFGGAGWWLLRHPMFNIQGISVQGEVTRNNAVTLRANVMPRLQGNFFTLDLNQAREAFESVPWVRVAVIHRDFPNRLRAVLLEHQAIAMWGEEGANTMLNQQGQVFEANVEDVDMDKLPRLKGPDDESQSVARMLQVLTPLFNAMDMELAQIELTPRGSWRVLTQHGASLELGRGTEAELIARLQVFFKTLTQITSRYGRTVTSLIAADLRHTDGYALRLRGVSTLDEDIKKKP